MTDLVTMARLSALFLLVCLGVGCIWVSPAERKEMRELRRESEIEAAAARAELDGTARATALVTIAQLEDARRGQDELVTFSRHADPVVRAAAARALGMVAEHGTAEVLVHLLEDADDRVVEQAAFALSQVEHFKGATSERAAMLARIEAALVLELDDCRRELRWGDAGREEICRVVVRSLGAMGGEAANEALWDALSKGIKPPALQRAVPLALAVQAKAGRGRPITAEQLGFIAPLLIQTDNPAQWAASYLLARAEVAEDAVEQARGLLDLAWARAGGTTARVWTLAAMAGLGGASAVAQVTAVLSDDADPRVHTAAARGAGKLGLGDALVTFLGAPRTPALQATAVGALGALEAPPEAALDWLIAHLEAPHPVVVTAAGGLASGSTQVAEALSLLLAHEDVGLRRAAASALVSIESAEQALLDAFAVEEDRGARINLAVALAERPSPAVEGVLLELVRGEDPILGAIAAEGLGPRKGGHIVMRLQEAYATANAEGDDERRLAIVRAALPREDASVDLARDAMNDPEPLVREAAWKVVIERFDRATLGELRPPPRPLPALDDPLRGVGDVTGATIHTSVGDIEVTLYPTLAPGAVANWVSLAEAGTYDGRVFFRVVPDFVVQTGDPMDTGWGGPGHTLRCEYTAEPYRRGTLGMATAGKDTGGSQWFITLSPHPHLDGRYTVFGQMSAGHEVLDGIGVGDRVERVVIHRQPQAEKDPAP